jgi:NAD(P)-dependent dehydrogenase (short-subunit alcohol dehydrogenase family)
VSVPEQLRFDGQVVIVTGAGRGLGRAYAIYLAARGAGVLVNDLGTGMDGTGADPALARSVAEEITAAGGRAHASGASVASTEGAESIVADALERFGRVDAVINNAGIITYDPFPQLTLERLRQHLAIHVEGTFNVTRAAWPHMVDQGYGRVLSTTSAGLFGSAPLLAYSTCKGALVSMTRSLAEAGAAHGIKVNGVAPAAETRMVTDSTLRAHVGLPALPAETVSDPGRAPEAVSPLVAVLAHRSCPVSGELLSAGLGRLARIFLAESEGIVAPGLEPEQILERWQEIVDLEDYAVPAATAEYVARREALIAGAAVSDAGGHATVD